MSVISLDYVHKSKTQYIYDLVDVLNSSKKNSTQLNKTKFSLFDIAATLKYGQGHSLLVSWCFKPSQPQRIISGIRETFILSNEIQLKGP